VINGIRGEKRVKGAGGLARLKGKKINANQSFAYALS